MSKSLHVFDFDGVLAVPWTDPEVMFRTAKDKLEAIAGRGDCVAVCSFNPRAIPVVDAWELPVHHIRAGANHEWSGTYDEAYRVDRCKSKQIKDILSKEWFDTVYFYDDDEDNIQAVNTHLPSVVTVLVNSVKGIDEVVIPDRRL